MAAQTVYVVQAFEMHRKRLVPTAKEPAKSSDAALRMAERTAERKGGAVAIEMTVDKETREVERSRVLGRFGQVPDDLDQLLEGG